MIFSSWAFIACFLPFTLLVWHWLNSQPVYAGTRVPIAFLVVASVVYYGFWNWKDIWILAFTVGFNFLFAKEIWKRKRSWKLWLGIAVNLAPLVFFKYSGKLLGASSLQFFDIGLQSIALPIGISFFTFQQIAYLADVYSGAHDPSKEDFWSYALFVTFFPQLIVGPIVRHDEMMPQFADPSRRRINWDGILAGVCLFSIGLAKKVLIADSLHPYVAMNVDTHWQLTFCDALFTIVAFSLEIYFDFSGYCDMACGSAQMFGINLPTNFNSPYKARSGAEYWRRWHITLFLWLQKYVYSPVLEKTKSVRLSALVALMACGLWHGAGWTFVLFGLVGWTLLMAEHGLKNLSRRLRLRALMIFECLLLVPGILAMNFLLRVGSLGRLQDFFFALSGLNGFNCKQPINRFLYDLYDSFATSSQALLKLLQWNETATSALVLAVLLIIVRTSPNSHELALRRQKPWMLVWIGWISILSFAAMALRNDSKPFLYFQF